MTDETDDTTAMVVHSDDALSAFGDDIGMERARGIANQLSQLIKERGLSVRIGQGEHLRVEAWCAAGAMVGLTPRTAWSKEARSPDGTILEGYEARVEVVRLSTGDVIGAAEAGCYFDETAGGRTRWTERHAAKSMSQTRAASKALGQVLRWIPVLAGYEGTPAEEMPRGAPSDADVASYYAQSGTPTGDGGTYMGDDGTTSPRAAQERRSPQPTPRRQGEPPQGVPRASDSDHPDAWMDTVFGTGKKILTSGHMKGVSVAELTWRQIVDGASVGGERHDYLRWIDGWLEGRIHDKSAAKWKEPNMARQRQVRHCIALIEASAAKDAQDEAVEAAQGDLDADIPF